MNRSLSRKCIIAATVLALAFASIPVSAQSSKVPVFRVPTSWLPAMLTVVGKVPILHGGQDSAHRGVQQKEKGDLTGPTIKITPHTGSCIDPDGYRVPCEGI